MTQSEAIHKVVSLAYGEVGYHEGANNYNKYADNPLVTQALGWNAQNQPWCALWVVWLFIEAFGYYSGTAMMYGCSAGCAVQASYYQNNGAFYPASEVQKGDQIFFYVGGGINHTGIVVDVSASTITTVEGNSSDSVAKRTYFVGDQSIAGVGRPLWSVVANEPSQDESDDDGCDGDSCPIEFRHYVTLKHGDGINSPMQTVKVWQSILLAWGFNLGKSGADGEFGALTLAATKKLQEKAEIDADGIVGEETWKQGILFPRTL